MLGYIFLGALAAFGGLCGLWALWGWLLPGGRKNVVLFLCRPGSGEENALSRYDFLRDLGLIYGPLLIIGSTLSAQEQDRIRKRHPGAEFCSLENLSARLEQEWKQLD